MGRKASTPNRQVSSYLRPEENPNLICHEAAEHILYQAWRNGRLAHAWLICGPCGIGKATLAYRFARFILTGDTVIAPHRSSGLYLSPEHPTFRRIASRSHTDFRIIERGYNEFGRSRTQIVVDDIRDVSRFLALTAAEGGWRVAVLDGVEAMSDSAGNALLKVLEEPPPQSLLLLVSHNPGRLLPTVRSRCRLLTLRPLAEQHVGALLKCLCPFLAPTEVSAVTRLADGSIGRCLMLVDNDGVALYRAMLDLLASMPRLDVPTLYTFCDKITQAEDKLFIICGELLKTLLVRVIRYSVLNQPMAEVILGEETLVSSLTAVVKLDRWVEVWGKISYLFSQVDLLNLDRRQVLLNAFLMIRSVVLL